MEEGGEIKTLDYSLCIICQTESEENLVENPVSHENVLNFIEERVKYGDSQYFETWKRLSGISRNQLAVSKASWHRKCYQDVAHIGKLKRIKERYEREMAGHDESRRKSNQLTRSKTMPYDRDVCFFCEKAAGYQDPLHSVSTTSAGHSLRVAIETAENDRLQVKLSSAIDSEDAVAIDIKYHKKCWARNVSSVLRKGADNKSNPACLGSAEIATEVEFLDLTKKILKDGQVPTMAELETAYVSILKSNNATSHPCSRKTLKRLISSQLSEVEFHKPKRLNESERLTIKKTRDAAVQLSEEVTLERSEEIKILYDAAAILRKCINKSKKWVFTGSLDSTSDENLPEELYCFFKWIVQGPSASITVEEKSSEVHKRAVSLAQSTISLTLTERQANNKKSEVIKVTREMPQQLGVGLAIHQAFRSKEIIKMLHGFGFSVEYNRLLRVEAQIEQSVIRRMKQNDGVYLPPDIVLGRHVFFAVDNVDFSEDTCDGRKTFHGAAMAIYQETKPGDAKLEVRFENTGNQIRTVKDLPETVTAILDCPKPPCRPESPVYPNCGLFAEKGIPIVVQLKDFAWLLGRTLTRTVTEENAEEVERGRDEQNLQRDAVSSVHLPVWSGYNSLIHNTMPVTRVSCPPLVAAPAHEWKTLLTILMQAQAIKTKIVGPERKTVISLDMGLYQPAKKLQMGRNDLDHLVLRPGELHIVMAQLRTIGAFIEDSGIDLCWIEADLYGPTTVKQIIDGNHVKRGQAAHMVTLQALFAMYQNAFFLQEPEFLERLQKVAEDLAMACVKGVKSEVQKAHAEMVEIIQSADVITRMKTFDDSHDKIPEFQVFRQYMTMVMDMILFISAVRTGDWLLHLTALKSFTKYFFAYDRLNYARMIPLYLAEMEVLPKSDPELYEEFLTGNWVVNKNQESAFCAVGADNALEHLNRKMKVSGGLVGITLNPNARVKFFLIAPELSQLSEQAKSMAGVSFSGETSHHHALTTAVFSREEKSVEKLLTTMESFTNPFDQESDTLFNLVTKVVMPENVKKDLCEQSIIGERLFQRFVEERIKEHKVNLWDPMKKQKLSTWKTAGKKVKVRVNNNTVELREDRNLFARMMVVCKSRPEIDIKEAVGTYEFSVVPRSLFAADGTLLRCSRKSALMDILETLPVDVHEDNDTGVNQNGQHTEVQMKVSVVDAMAEVQCLDKPEWVKKCSHLADHFTNRIFQKFGENEELRLVFDRYDIPFSLKERTRTTRLGEQNAVYYHITPSTHIARVPMKKLLSHTKTKMELADYLAQKTIEVGVQNGRRVVVAWGSECKGTREDFSYLQSNHEEADTKIILHAVDATSRGATDLRIYSLDTDVLVLAIRRYSSLCRDTLFITGTGRNHREIQLYPIYRALGPERAAALPAFHALSGADNTGCFSGKGKTTCWKAFMEADDEITDGLSQLGGTATIPTDDTMALIEKLVCQLYLPKTEMSSVSEVRWWLFRKKQAQSERLPPTQATLRQAISRAHHQALVWNNDIVANPTRPSPENYGWELHGDKWVPVMTTLPPAPQAIIHLVKCKCAKERCSTNRCQCKKNGLNCTDLCGCSDNKEQCENVLEDDSDDEINNEEGDDDPDDDDDDHDDVDDL